MKSVGLTKRRKIGGEPTDGKRRAEQRLTLSRVAVELVRPDVLLS